MDRRIEKSKQAIMDAFTKLMLEKDFEKITINEIAELANRIYGRTIIVADGEISKCH